MIKSYKICLKYEKITVALFPAATTGGYAGWQAPAILALCSTVASTAPSVPRLRVAAMALRTASAPIRQDSRSSRTSASDLTTRRSCSAGLAEQHTGVSS